MGDRILREATDIAIAKAPEGIETRYNEIFWVGAITNLLSCWLRDGMKTSPREMARLCVDIVTLKIEEQL